MVAVWCSMVSRPRKRFDPNGRPRPQQRCGMDRVRVVFGAQAHGRGRLWLRPRARRGVRFQRRLALRPCLFPSQGRQGRAGGRDLEGHVRAHARQARGGPRRHRVRQADDLCRLVQVSDRDRQSRACRHRRADEAARGAQEEARRRRPVRRGAQAAAAVPSESHRCHHITDRCSDPRYSSSSARPVSPTRAGMAGARAGRDISG